LFRIYRDRDYLVMWGSCHKPSIYQSRSRKKIHNQDMTHGTRVDGSTEMKVSGFNWGFLGPAFTNSGGKTQGFQPFPHLSGSAPSKDGKESPLVSMS